MIRAVNSSTDRQTVSLPAMKSDDHFLFSTGMCYNQQYRYFRQLLPGTTVNKVVGVYRYTRWTALLISVHVPACYEGVVGIIRNLLTMYGMSEDCCEHHTPGDMSFDRTTVGPS